MNTPKNLVEQAKQTITNCKYFNIASVTVTGLPWNTPVYFTFDQDYNFYWGSPKDSVHSANIKGNSNVFITIYPPTEDGVGVYIDGNAVELSDTKEISNVLKILSRDEKGNTNKPEDFLEESPLRMYKATIKKVYISTPETSEKYKDLWVDHRIEIKLLSENSN